jgi:heme oxygenase
MKWSIRQCRAARERCGSANQQAMEGATLGGYHAREYDMPSSIENPVPSSQPDDDPPIADLDKRAYYKYMESRLNLFEANLSALRSDMNAGFDKLQRDIHVLQETTRRLDGTLHKLELSDIKTQADMEMLRHDIAYIHDNFATKADLQEAMMKLTLRVMGMMMVMTGSLVGAMFFIARHSS